MKKLQYKQHILLNLFLFGFAFISLSGIIIYLKLSPTLYMTWELGIIMGFVLGIFLTMSLFFLAKYEMLKDIKKEEKD